VRGKLGWSGALAALGISGVPALSRYLSGERAVPDEVVRRALGQLEEGGSSPPSGQPTASNLGSHPLLPLLQRLIV